MGKKTAWISGGGGAIGGALAKKLAEQGWIVYITGRNLDSLKKVALHHPNIMPTVGNICHEKEITDLIHQLPKLDLAILNAGAYMPGPTSETSISQCRHLMDVNYFGAVTCFQALKAKMLQQPQSTCLKPPLKAQIIFVGSLAGYRGLPNASGYGASKAALISFVESCYSELNTHPLKIQLVNPGFVRSALTDKNNFNMPDLISADQAANYILNGMKKDVFEITFPPRFAFFMKIIRLLPNVIFFKLMRKINK